MARMSHDKIAHERDPLLQHAAEDTTASPANEATVGCSSTDHEDEETEEGGTSGFAPKLGVSMFDFFTTGCAMAAVGALIPDIERHYDTSDGMTAFIFPAGMLGYLGATASVEAICQRLGRRGIAILSPVIRMLAGLVLATAPAYGVLLVTYVVFGYGTGLTDTAWNAWASGMQRSNVWQGLLHGSFSLGCVTGPLIATAVLTGHSWSAFYLVIAILSCIELLTQGWAFRHETRILLLKSQEDTAAPVAPAEDSAAKPLTLVRKPAIWICGAFYFFYQGVEVTFNAWIVVFMLRTRHADHTIASLASSTFWIGMTVGRYVLGLVTERFGVAISVAAYITLALCFQLMLNLVTNVNVTMALLAANGFSMAPLFPSGIVLLVSRLETNLHMRAVALLIALGQVGGAIAPLAVGFMADALGIRHLFEMVCGLTATMLVLWIVFARSG